MICFIFINWFLPIHWKLVSPHMLETGFSSYTEHWFLPIHWKLVSPHTLKTGFTPYTENWFHPIHWKLVSPHTLKTGFSSYTENWFLSMHWKLIKCNATKSWNKSIVHSVIKIKLYYYRSEIIDNPLQKENERITIFMWKKNWLQKCKR
jgi:hypothetical protein